MRTLMVRALSAILVGLGILSVVFVGSGLLAPAVSQGPPDMALPPDLAPIPDNSPPPGSSISDPAVAEEPMPSDPTVTNPMMDSSVGQSVDGSLPQAPQDMGLPPNSGIIEGAVDPQDPNVTPLGGDPANTEGRPPGFISIEGYSYNPEGRRDPFKPFGPYGAPDLQPLPVPDATAQPELPPPDLDPLQLYDLNQLRVVAIVWGVKKPRAMIKDPVGKLHVVSKDTKIGRNNGFVALIREGEVVVVEPFEEAGVTTAQTRILELNQ